VAVAHAGQTGIPFSQSAATGVRRVVWIVFALLAVLPLALYFKQRRSRSQ
jgi:hypothetical protein